MCRYDAERRRVGAPVPRPRAGEFRQPASLLPDPVVTGVSARKGMPRQ